MNQSKALKFFDNMATYTDGDTIVSESGIFYQKWKGKEQYLNKFSDEVDTPLNKLDYPFLFTSLIRCNEDVERFETTVIESPSDLEVALICLLRADVIVLTKNNWTIFDFNFEPKVIELFAQGFTHIAAVHIDGKQIFTPVHPRASLAEAALQAAKFLPGHLFYFNSRTALAVYNSLKEQYPILHRKNYLDEVRKLAEITNQLGELEPQLIFKIEEIEEELSTYFNQSQN